MEFISAVGVCWKKVRANECLVPRETLYGANCFFPRPVYSSYFYIFYVFLSGSVHSLTPTLQDLQMTGFKIRLELHIVVSFARLTLCKFFYYLINHFHFLIIIRIYIK